MSAGFTPVSLPDLSGPSDGVEQRGFAAGYAEGLRHAAEQHRAAEAVRDTETERVRADLRARTQQAIDALGRAGAQLNARVVETVEMADRVLVESALDLAEAILDREVTDGHVTASDALRRALDTADRSEVTTVRLHPQDVAALTGTDLADGMTLVADTSIAPGDSAAMLRHGWYDARIRASLDRVRAVLLGGDR